MSSEVERLKREAGRERSRRTAEKQKRAFALYCEASRLDPNDAEVWRCLGEIIDEAEADEEQFVRVAELREIVGAGVEFNQITCWERAVSLRPDDLGAWLLLGRVHSSAENGEEAIRCLERVVGLDAGHVEALCRLAQWLHASAVQGDEYDEIVIGDAVWLERAADCYARAIAANEEVAAKKHEAFYWMAEIALLRKDERVALKWFERQVAATGDAHCRKQARGLRRKLGG